MRTRVQLTTDRRLRGRAALRIVRVQIRVSHLLCAARGQLKITLHGDTPIVAVLFSDERLRNTHLYTVILKW